MKHLNSIMSVLLAAPLVLAGCPSGDDGDEGANDSTTTDTPATTTGNSPETTTGADSSGGESSSGDPPPMCSNDPATPETIPPAPVDCSGADGVLMTSVIIDDSPESDDPSILENVRRVEGSIVISRTDLTDLNFMACVEEVTGEVNLFDNDALTNVDGLWSLTELGTDLKISQNDALVDFNGAPNLLKIIGNLIVTENDALQAITGFHSLVGFDGSGIDPETGNTIGGNITIQQNDALTHIDGLIGLRVVNGVLAITNNPMLCLSSVACVGTGIVQPVTPPDSWSITGNNPDC